MRFLLSRGIVPIINGGGLDPEGQEMFCEEIFFMKKWTGFFVIGLLLSLPMVCSAEELGGVYSVTPPDGWMVRDFPGSPYKGLFGTTTSNFTPNINIQEENHKGSMDKYIEGSFL